MVGWWGALFCFVAVAPPPPLHPPLPSPLTSPSVSARPPCVAGVYRASMKDCSTSSSAAPADRRAAMTAANTCANSVRAASRFRCAAMGIRGKRTEMGSMPASRSWKREVTRVNRRSRTSLPGGGGVGGLIEGYYQIAPHG